MKNLITAVAFLAFGYAASAQTAPSKKGTKGTTMTDTITTQPRSKSVTDKGLYKSDTIHGSNSSTRKTDKTSTTKSTISKKKNSTDTQTDPIDTNNGTRNNGTGTSTNQSGTNNGDTQNNRPDTPKTP